MRNLICFVFCLGHLVGCKDVEKNARVLQEPGWQVAPSSLPKLVPLNPKAQDLAANWKAYQVFKTSFDRIYSSEYREDFVLAIEDLIERQKELEDSEYPQKYDVPQIKARQKVLKTYILKTKGNLEYRQAPEPAIKEMIQAHNALRVQFNTIANNTLPEELIKNEE